MTAGRLALVAFAACATACGGGQAGAAPGEPPPCRIDAPDATPEAVWAYLLLEDYRNTWAHEPAFDGPRPNFRGGNPHGATIEILVNDCVPATWGTGATRYPAGATIVLSGSAQFVAYRATDAADEAGWWWAAFQAGGIPIGETGVVSTCFGCHSTGDDFVRAFTLEGH
jgi:hypothetical protein